MDKTDITSVPRTFHMMPLIPVSFPGDKICEMTVVRLVLKERFNKRYPHLLKSESFLHGMTVTDKEPCPAIEVNRAGSAIFRNDWCVDKKAQFHFIAKMDLSARWGLSNTEVSVRHAMIKLPVVGCAEAFDNEPFKYVGPAVNYPGFVRDTLVYLPIKAISKIKYGDGDGLVGNISVRSPYIVTEDIEAKFVDMNGGQQSANIKGLFLQHDLGAILDNGHRYPSIPAYQAKALNSKIAPLLK